MILLLINIIYLCIFKKCMPISQSEILQILLETYGNYR